MHQAPLSLEMDSSNWKRWKSPLVIYGLNQFLDIAVSQSETSVSLMAIEKRPWEDKIVAVAGK